MQYYDVIIIGGGAAGLMCGISAGNCGKSTLLLEHGSKVGAKIYISGGGRCNFTNMGTTAENYLSANPHFIKSALAQYSQWDFLDLLQRHKISWHEKKLGQLFCNQGASAIVEMLEKECASAGVIIQTDATVTGVEKTAKGFQLLANDQSLACRSLVVATGGLSIPKMGATGFAYHLARQFDVAVRETRPALVPFTFQDSDLAWMKKLTGVSVPVSAAAGGVSFTENLLFTHRGLSGPAMLQISSHWHEGMPISINLLPGLDAAVWLREQWQNRPRARLSTLLSGLLPGRFVAAVFDRFLDDCQMASLSNEALRRCAGFLNNWHLKPQGSEGYRTAEVTRGGIDCDALVSKTMEARDVPGLYFIGECVDVTGWLGGYNFQWAWSSGWVAGQYA